jgi:hypothetical protein
VLSVAPAAGSTLSAYSFAATDSLVLRNFGFAGLEHSFVENKAKTEGVLTLIDGKLNVTIDLFGQHVAAGFHFAQDGAGTAITYSAPTSAHAGELAAGHGG